MKIQEKRFSNYISWIFLRSLTIISNGFGSTSERRIQDGSLKNLISRSYKNLKNDGSLETVPRKRSRLLMTDNWNLKWKGIRNESNFSWINGGCPYNRLKKSFYANLRTTYKKNLIGYDYIFFICPFAWFIIISKINYKYSLINKLKC